MKIVWSHAALGDLKSLRAYIAKDAPAAARAQALAIIAAIEALAAHPQSGRPGRVPGTRELVVANTPYVVPYRVQEGALFVLRVYHSARRWPDQF